MFAKLLAKIALKKMAVGALKLPYGSASISLGGVVLGSALWLLENPEILMALAPAYGAPALGLLGVVIMVARARGMVKGIMEERAKKALEKSEKALAELKASDAQK